MYFVRGILIFEVVTELKSIEFAYQLNKSQNNKIDSMMFTTEIEDEDCHEQYSGMSQLN